MYFNFDYDMINKYKLQQFLEEKKRFLIIFKMFDLEKFKFLIVIGFEHYHFAIFLKYFFPEIFKSNFHYQNLASSPSVCKKQKIVKNLLIFTCLEQPHFAIFQRTFMMKILHLYYLLIISLPEVWTIQWISTWNQANVYTQIIYREKRNFASSKFQELR